MLITAFICALTIASDNSRFRMTGSRQEKISSEEIVSIFTFFPFTDE